MLVALHPFIVLLDEDFVRSGKIFYFQECFGFEAECKACGENKSDDAKCVNISEGFVHTWCAVE